MQVSGYAALTKENTGNTEKQTASYPQPSELTGPGYGDD